MRHRLAWGGAMVPALLGLGLAVLLQRSPQANLILGFMVDLGSVLLVAGVLITTLVLGYLAVQVIAGRRQERALAEERGRAAEAHRRFVQRLDHELKNPLTAMRIGLADLCGESLQPGQREAAAGLAAQVGRLGRLAGDLRKLVELEGRPLELSTIEIGPMLEEIVELIQAGPFAAERRVTLTVPRAPWPLPPTPGDRDLIYLAIYNLVDNALKFTRPGDTVEVRASEDGTGVVVEVADTGLGVPEEEQPHVFEELYRGQGARGIAGSGLGLALVKAIVERHAGTITLRSRPGQGSVFSLRLPASPA